MQANQIKNVKVIDGPCRIADAQVVRVGFWRNPALAEANEMRDDIPNYRGTFVVTLNVVHKDNLDVLKKLKANGDDIRRAFVTANIHVNEGDETRTPIDGEVLKEVTIRQLMDEDGESPLIHGERSALEGRAIHQARVVAYYPPAKIDDVSLEDLLGGGEAFEEKKKPVSTEDGVTLDDLSFDEDEEAEVDLNDLSQEQIKAILAAQKKDA